MLSNSILEVGVDVTEGETLAAIVASFLEGIVMETPVVWMRTPCLAAKVSKACLAAIVSMAELLI